MISLALLPVGSFRLESHPESIDHRINPEDQESSRDSCHQKQVSSAECSRLGSFREIRHTSQGVDEEGQLHGARDKEHKDKTQYDQALPELLVQNLAQTRYHQAGAKRSGDGFLHGPLVQ